MKIVCENCQAKYSIADEKVAGKVFKIRCKRCSEVIVVRGDEQPQAAAEADPTRVYDYGPDAIWHVVINGEQQGPFAPAQLGEMLTNGTVDWEAYVWAEGFDNWVPMQDVEDLVAAITGGEQPQGAASMGAAEANAFGGGVAASLAAQPSMGADPFADDSSAAGADLFGDNSAQSGGADLFGAQQDSSPFSSPASDGVVASSPGPRVSSEDAMTGARNENSVLFSLKNLQALATGSSTPSVAPGGGADAFSSGDGIGGGGGFAAGEGSGLIDIRALASATGVGDGDGTEGSKDELLSMGSQTGAFGSLGSPMLAPAADDDDDNKKTIIWAAVAGAAFLSIAAVAIAYILKPAAPPPEAAAVVPSPAAAAAAAASPQAAGDKAAEEEEDEEAEAPSEGELAAKKATEEEEKDDKKSSSSRKRRSKRSGSSSSPDSDDSSGSEAPAPAAKEAPKRPTSSEGASIDDLLNNALAGGGGKPKRAAPAPADSNLPSKPSRDDVLKAMNSVKGEVQSCAKGQSGVAFANITVSGSSGRVTNAQISGITGPTGSCIARAVRKAKFPKFSSKVFKVKFPFRL